MIGSAIAIRFYAKKPWLIALAFWAVYLVIGLLFVSQVASSLDWWLGMALSFLIFMALATFWLKLAPVIGIICFAFAYVIDFVIMYVMAMLGFSLSSLLGGIGL